MADRKSKPPPAAAARIAARPASAARKAGPTAAKPPTAATAGASTAKRTPAPAATAAGRTANSKIATSKTAAPANSKSAIAKPASNPRAAAAASTATAPRTDGSASRVAGAAAPGAVIKSDGKSKAESTAVYDPAHAKLDSVSRIGIANFDPRVEVARAVFKAAASGDVKRLTAAMAKLKTELISVTRSWGIAGMNRFGQENTIMLRAINTKATSLDCVRLLCRKGVSATYAPPGRCDFPLLKAVMIASVPIITYLLIDRKCDVNQTTRVTNRESAGSLPVPYNTREPWGECAVQRAIRTFGNRCVPPQPQPAAAAVAPASTAVTPDGATPAATATATGTGAAPAMQSRPSGGALTDRRTDSRPYSETQQLLPLLLSHGADVSRLNFHPIWFEDRFDSYNHRTTHDPAAAREPEWKLSCSILMLAFEVDAVDVVRFLVDYNSALAPVPAAATVNLHAVTKAGNVAHWIRSAAAFHYIQSKGVDLHALSCTGDDALASAIRRNAVAGFDLLLPHFDVSDGRALFAAIRYRPAELAHFIRALTARGVVSIEPQIIEGGIAKLPKLKHAAAPALHRREHKLRTASSLAASAGAAAAVAEESISAQPLHRQFAILLSLFPLTRPSYVPQQVSKRTYYAGGDDDDDGGEEEQDVMQARIKIRAGTVGASGERDEKAAVREAAEAIDSDENESETPLDDDDGGDARYGDHTERARVERYHRFNRNAESALILSICTAYDTGARSYIDRFVAPLLGQTPATASGTDAVSAPERADTMGCDFPPPLVAIIINYLFTPQFDLVRPPHATSPALPLKAVYPMQQL